MANIIKIKQSSVEAKVPLAADLEQGELALNTFDEKLYTKNSSGNVVQLNSAQYTDADARLAVGTISQDLTGHLDRSQSGVSFNEVTATFTWTVPSEATVFQNGAQYSVTSNKSIVITDVDGGRYIKYNPTSGLLEEILPVGTNPTFSDDILVGYVYWNSDSDSAIIAGDERHGSARDTEWHKHTHLYQGMQWFSGGSLDYTLDDDTAVTLGFSTPIVVADEDLYHSFTHSATPSANYEQVLDSDAELPVIWYEGSGKYSEIAASSTPWSLGVNGRAQYNNIALDVGTLVEAGNNKYIVYWIVATNDIHEPVKVLMGQGEYANHAEATEETFESYGLPVPEIVPLYRIIFETQTAHASGVVLKSVSSYYGVNSSIGGAGAFSTTDHSALSGRSNADQHPIGAVTGLQAELDSKTSFTSSEFAPVSPNSGDTWYEPSEDVVYLWVGSKWMVISSTSATIYDGGDANNSIYTQTIDGGDATTITYTETIDGGGTDNPIYTELEGGDASTIIYTEIEGGDATTKTYTQTIDGGGTNNPIYTEIEGGDASTTTIYTEIEGGDATTQTYTQTIEGGLA